MSYILGCEQKKFDDSSKISNLWGVAGVEISAISLDFQCLNLFRLENMCPRMTVSTSFDAPRSEECNAF